MTHNSPFTSAKKTILFAIFFLITQTGLAWVQKTFSTPYGNNLAAGKYAEVSGIKMYYEIYGEVAPMVHGNGGSVASMANQIEYFKSKYKVIVADGRAQGKSGDTNNRLSYPCNGRR